MGTYVHYAGSVRRRVFRVVPAVLQHKVSGRLLALDSHPVYLVAQAVSYQYRRKRGNLYGTRFFDILLVISGALGLLSARVAVSMMFFGADFKVTMGNILTPARPVISQWGAGHGWEAIFCWRNWILGFAVLFLARTQCALLYEQHSGRRYILQPVPPPCACQRHYLRLCSSWHSWHCCSLIPDYRLPDCIASSRCPTNISTTMWICGGVWCCSSQEW